VELSPNEPQVWRAHFGVLEHAERWDEILQDIERAIRTAPTNAPFWITKAAALEKVSRLDEALAASERAVALDGTNAIAVESGPSQALLVRSVVLRRLNRLAEAAADNLAALGIPMRDPTAGANLIDLSLHYNASLTMSDWFRPSDVAEGNDLSELPRGLHELAGVPFDLRGLVQVGWFSRFGRHPAAVSGIAVQLAELQPGKARGHRGFDLRQANRSRAFSRGPDGRVSTARDSLLEDDPFRPGISRM
jgi:tetratricopeptide (TPR) repeat protein